MKNVQILKSVTHSEKCEHCYNIQSSGSSQIIKINKQNSPKILPEIRQMDEYFHKIIN